MSVVLPEKTYFKIGEAAQLVGVKPYIIRYWETEFRALRPAKTKSRQRLFRHRDVHLLLVIKKLLYEQKFTIEGARRRLKELQGAGVRIEEMLDALDQPVVPEADVDAAGSPDDATQEELGSLRSEVERLKAELARHNDATAPDGELQALVAAAHAQAEELESSLSACRRELRAAESRAERAEQELAAERERAGAFAADMRKRWRRLLRAAAPAGRD